jgi:hypothetical protein
MTDTKDINPVYVDGEPFCSRSECLQWRPASRYDHPDYAAETCGDYGWHPVNSSDACIPALRRDRDLLQEQVRTKDLEINELKFAYGSLEASWKEGTRLLATRFAARRDYPARVERAAKAVEQCVREAIRLEEHAENMDAQDWQDLYFGEAAKILAAADAEE